MFSAAGKTAAVATAVNYIEDVFSTWLYSGNGSTQTITNGIDLSTKGGLVWIKSRSAGYGHYIFDTNRGALNRLASNGTGAESSISNSLTSFLSNGFSLGSEVGVNESPGNYASWTFRKQPKFFDVVTYTGDAGSNRAVAHNLGSVPGCIIVKSTSDAGTNWVVYHRSLGDNKYVMLNSTAASATAGIFPTVPTATEFYVGNFYASNSSGVSYVAYLFAHDAGGFGLTGTDNVITCGSYTGNGSTAGPTITLGYEPQWLLVKPSSASGSWYMIDTMRGFNLDNDNPLFANNANVEAPTTIGFPTATGFTLDTTGAPNISGATYIYIAIRRGPMKTPTTGTSVFSPNTSSAGTGTTLTTNFPTDLQMQALRTSAVSDNTSFFDRLRGFSTTPTNETGQRLISSATDAETSPANQTRYFNNTGFQIPSNWGGSSVIYLNFRRAPGFFDVVCYTGTGSSSTSFSHNLGVAPELIISKTRSGSTSNWIVTSNFTSTNYRLTALNLTIAADTFLYTDGASISAQPTSTTLKFTGGVPAVNDSGATYVAYLFASCPGVSKVGSYTGTGNTLQVDCGFTGGARFVLIKRTDSTGDWYVWDSARGIVSGNDSYLVLNSTAAEVTNTDWVDTYSAGFELSNAAGNNVNINTATYIFLSVA